MKKAFLALSMLVLFLPASAAAETWKNAPLVDAMCSTKAKPDPDSHTTKCALACAKGGFGILTADGAYLKFDEAGNREAAAALKNTKKENKLRATVTGERDGDTIKVQSLSLE